MAIKITKLMTVKNYAKMEDVTPSYIYKLVKADKMECVVIDGVQFINTEMFPSLPVAVRRNR
jgi:predicted ATP-dependent serine protease